MNDELKKWQNEVVKLEGENSSSADAQFLDRVLMDWPDDSKQDFEYAVRALQMENQIDCLPMLKASTSLQKKLYAIPKNRNPAFSWAGALSAAAVIVLALFIGVFSEPKPLLQQHSLTSAEVEKAKEELYLALNYISSTNRLSREHIGSLISSNIENAMDKAIDITGVKNSAI